MIRTVNLVKVYQTDEVETTALNELNIEIKEGEFVSIMGPSGCGKIYLIKCIGYDRQSNIRGILLHG